MSTTQDPPSPVDINLAQDETKAWRQFSLEFLRANTPGNMVNGYYIPIADINAVIAAAQSVGTTASAVRAYFALRTSGDSAQANLHMYIVAVDDATGDDIIQNQAGDSLIYDTTIPCPTMCGTGNVLNGGVNQ